MTYELYIEILTTWNDKNALLAQSRLPFNNGSYRNTGGHPRDGGTDLIHSFVLLFNFLHSSVKPKAKHIVV